MSQKPVCVQLVGPRVPGPLHFTKSELPVKPPVGSQPAVRPIPYSPKRKSHSVLGICVCSLKVRKTVSPLHRVFGRPILRRNYTRPTTAEGLSLGREPRPPAAGRVVWHHRLAQLCRQLNLFEIRFAAQLVISHEPQSIKEQVSTIPLPLFTLESQSTRSRLSRHQFARTEPA